MGSLAGVIAAGVGFVGSHFLLSHPLRAPIVRRVGEGPFLGLYSVVAFATLGWLVFAYRAVPQEAPLWPVSDTLWITATLLMLVASVLLMGSLIGNPALPNPDAQRQAAPLPRGVFTITRHPMMWSFALWGLVHILIVPTPSGIAVAVTIIVLALVGAALQDRKKEQLEPELWREWEARTSYWPFGGRARIGGFRGHELAGGLVVWLAATWAHIPLAGVPAGIWRWIA
jgi:uncharacterized membrane protein